MMLLLEFIIIF